MKNPWIRWGAVLGFALGGFFDGILLHQILQWHHLLSLVPGMTDLRTQVLWDGYFHALMYVLAALGLWGLWRAHRTVEDGWGRQISGALLVGFGLWHVLDAVLSHWLLGIHRIKLDSDHPLVWDVAWLAVFGVLPAIVGWVLLRQEHGSGPNVRSATPIVVLLGLISSAAGAWSMQPPQVQPLTTVVFRPGLDAWEIQSALASVDAKIAWADPAMRVVVVDVERDRRWSLYRQGALLVSGSLLPGGCLDWSKA